MRPYNFYRACIIIFVHVHTERIKTFNVHELGIDWTGDHCAMAEASTDSLVDEDGTHVSNCCVKICNVLQIIVRIIPSHLPDFSFWKLAFLDYSCFCVCVYSCSVCYLATCTYLNVLSCCVRQTVAVVTTSDMFLFSCRAGRPEVVRMLIDEFNCDAQCTDTDGSTPLHYACRYAYSL